MNMRALISAFDSDFAILEDAGRNKFSMADKFKKINTAQKKCGNQYATIFTMIESAGTLDDTFNYKKGCQLLIGHYNRHFDPTHDKLLEGLSGGAPTPVAVRAPLPTLPTLATDPTTASVGIVIHPTEL